MKRLSVLLIVLWGGLAVCCAPDSPRYRIWFKEPAAIWEATLPLGNGSIGMMPDGKIREETIVLNDITLWSGGIQDADNPEAATYLPEIRKLLFEGKNDLAQDLVYKTFVCKGKGSGKGSGANVPYGSYEMLGKLHLRFDLDSAAKPENYHRQLILDDAVAQTAFTLNRIHFTREYFVSFTDKVGIIRLKTSGKGALNLAIGIDRPEKSETKVEGNLLKMSGQLENGTDGKGMRFQTLVSAKTKGGKVITEGNRLRIQNADEVLIFVSAGTDYKNPEFPQSEYLELENASVKKYNEMKKSHIAEYRKFFNRVELNLPINPEREKLTITERLTAFAENPDDNGLVNLYFQYGRYLLISSACAQILPPNL
jgi:alpha-L-fucosidase 2